MGVGFRPFGHIMSENIYVTGARIPLDSVAAIGVENELVFHFGKDVPSNASESEVEDSIEALSPGFELNQSRLPRDASQADRLADNLSNWGIVVGEQIFAWQQIDLDDLVVTLNRDGVEVQSVAARGHIDRHIESLSALSATLALFDRQILAGDQVITGAYTRQRVVEPSRWVGDFGASIGKVEIEWT